MKGHDHVAAVVCVVGYVSVLERKTIIYELFCDLAAEFYDILLKVETNDLCSYPAQFGEVIVKGKCQICFAASEVYYFEAAGRAVCGAAGRQVFVSVTHDLQKPVDLSEFRIMSFKDIPVFVHYTELYKKRTWLAFFDDIVLFTVMREDVR